MPITGEDIRYSFEDNFLNTDVYANPSRAANWGGAPIQVEVIDDTTVRLRWAKLYAGWINGDWRPGAWQHPIRPSHFLKQFHKDYRSMDELLPVMKEAGFEGADDWGRFYLSVDPGRWRGQFISGGLKGTFDMPVFSPWMPVAEPSAGEYVLERNPYYYMVDVAGNQLPYIDTVHRTFVSNREVVDLAIIQGDTDFQVYEPTLEQFTLYKENENAGGYRTMLLPPRQDMTGVIVFNLTTSDEAVREMVQDVRFRRATADGAGGEDDAFACGIDTDEPGGGLYRHPLIWQTVWSWLRGADARQVPVAEPLQGGAPSLDAPSEADALDAAYRLGVGDDAAGISALQDALGLHRRAA